MTNVDINPEKPLRGWPLSWVEFNRLTGRQRPDYAAKAANDNKPVISLDLPRPRLAQHPKAFDRRAAIY